MNASSGRVPLIGANTMNTTAVDRGDGEKVLAMAVLGLGSLVSGMLPAIISERNRHRFPLTTSMLLCLGAGILLATALVHILPEVRKQMDSNFAEVALCGGFFIIYFIDEFIHYFFGEAIQHTHNSSAPNHSTSSLPTTATTPSTNHSHNDSRYGAVSIQTESTPLLNETTQCMHESRNTRDANRSANNVESTRSLTHSHSHQHCDEAVASANARICHTSHTEPCAQSMTGTLGLFVALSLHSTIEGLAIGIQNSASKVLFLLGAVACHKFVMGFCLGLELRSNPQASLRAHTIAIVVFAMGACCGIGVGMLIVDMPNNWSSSTLPIIQAIAGGTLFYVTVCEVIPREKARWHQNSAYKIAGFAQFAAVALGFAIMCIINFYIRDEDDVW